jgi:hypothetical protein
VGLPPGICEKSGGPGVIRMIDIGAEEDATAYGDSGEVRALRK